MPLLPTAHRLARRVGGWLAAVPSQCALCHAWPARALCDACIRRFAQPAARCARCALRVPAGVHLCGQCLRHPSSLDLCLACCDYAWPWTQCIARFKYASQPGWATPLAQLMRQMPGAEQVLEGTQRLLPMPLDARRLRERGFNQALELARHLRPDRVDATMLQRVRATPPQAGLNRAQRLRNLRGAFAIDAARGHELRGQHIALVDDVMTTGASLACAAEVLRQAGAAQITALVFARTG